MTWSPFPPDGDFLCAEEWWDRTCGTDGTYRTDASSLLRKRRLSPSPFPLSRFDHFPSACRLRDRDFRGLFAAGVSSRTGARLLLLVLDFDFCFVARATIRSATTVTSPISFTISFSLLARAGVAVSFWADCLECAFKESSFLSGNYGFIRSGTLSTARAGSRYLLWRSQKRSKARTISVNFSAEVGLTRKALAPRSYARETSWSSFEEVKMTTMMPRQEGWALIQAKTSNPCFTGSLRSSRTSEGSGWTDLSSYGLTPAK